MMDWLMDHAPKIGLLGFFIAFVGIAIFAYWPKNKARLEAHGTIPLKE